MYKDAIESISIILWGHLYSFEPTAFTMAKTLILKKNCFIDIVNRNCFFLYERTDLFQL